MSKKLKILIIGAGGGREHAIGWKLKSEERVGQIYFAPGNAGTPEIGINVSISSTDIPKLMEFMRKEKIDLALAISDDPLALGVVDAFQAEKLRIWGPSKAAAELEWSKAYAKDFMKRHHIPTARYGVFHDLKNAEFHLTKGRFPIVIKASGLALGKGVTICQTKEDAMDLLHKIFVDKIFGAAGNEVVIEEFLEGVEISIHAISDGINWKIFPASQDHKRVYEGNTGPNTGGMGAIAPLPFINDELMARIEKEIIAPTIQGMREEGREFRGILYPGIMLTKDGPQVFEFNARFGDPETQTYMRLLNSSLLEMLEASIDRKVGELNIEWKNLSSASIALASGGYPEQYEKGKVITGIQGAEMQPDTIVFHSGTAIKENRLLTNGGRVLWVTCTGIDLKDALYKTYKAIEKITFEGMHYRKDIGKIALELNK